MKATIIGFVNLDEFIEERDIDALLRLKFNDNYSEFVFGAWKNCVLSNDSGSAGDCFIHEYDGPAQSTGNLGDTSRIRNLLEACFAHEHLKWVRVFVQEKGFLLPHVDFLDMRRGFTRVHLPLRTNSGCLHSEEDEVYHMRAGEIWHVEATRIHSAANLSGRPRVSLCVDFAPGLPLAELINPAFRAPGGAGNPYMVERRPFDEEDRATLRKLGRSLAEHNFDDLVARLIRLHFETRIPAESIFDWLDELVALSGEPALRARAALLRKVALGDSTRPVTLRNTGVTAAT